jgi:excisionase family DNA binding protein
MMEAAARNPLLLSSEPAVADDRPMAKVFSPATLASRWGCSERHIRRLIQDEELASFRAGTLIRIKASDVLEHEFKMQRLNEEASPNEIIPAASEDEPRKRKKPAARLDTPAMRTRWRMQKERGGK